MTTGTGGGALIGALLLAAGLGAGLWLWRDWGLLVFLNGGGLSCW